MSTKEEKIEILKDIFGEYYNSSEEIIFYCPKCKHHKKKLSINVEKDKFKCWTCNYSGKTINRLVKRFGSFYQRRRWEELIGSVDLSVSFYEQMFGEEKEDEEQIVNLPKEFVSLVNGNLPQSSRKPLSYLKSRGITKEMILRWKMGYCHNGEFEGRVIVPSFNLDGNANFYVGRSYTGDWKKYKIPEHITKDIVFNELYVDWKNDIVLVEGVFDAVKAKNSIPLLGSTLREDSKLFQEIVKNDSTVYLALDPDAEKKALKLIKALISYDLEVYKIDVSGYQDVGEMSETEFQERKNNAIKMDSHSYLEYEVQAAV